MSEPMSENAHVFAWSVSDDYKKREDLSVDADWPTHIGDQIKATEMFFDSSDIPPAMWTERLAAYDTLLQGYKDGTVTDCDPSWPERTQKARDELAASMRINQRLQQLMVTHASRKLSAAEYREATTLIFKAAKGDSCCLACQLTDRDPNEPRNRAVFGLAHCKDHLRYDLSYQQTKDGPVRRLLQVIMPDWPDTPQARN